MLIREIAIPEGLKGLQGFKMTRLDRVVLLTGPNGGGKSRLLQSVSEQCGSYLVGDDYQYAKLDLDRTVDQIKQLRDRLANKPDGENPAGLINHISSLDEHRKNITSKLNARDGIVFDNPPTKKINLVHYYARNVEVKDWRDQNFHTSDIGVVEAVSRFNLAPIAQNVVSIVRTICSNYYMTSGEPDASDDELRVATLRHQRLCAMVQDFIGVPLKWNSTEKGPTLFGRSLHEASLSEGQKILLVVATSLALQDGTGEDLILLLDEPEKHLHPKAVLELLDRLDKACPNAQLWIATHSVHVLAHYGERCIWSVRDGRAQHAGREWASVLESLIGSSEHSDKVRSFLGLPAAHAMFSFAAECLVPPDVADTPPGDPQTTQIAAFLKSVRTRDAPMRLVDFGAGQGRLLGELMQQSSRFREDFDYFAFDQTNVKEEYRTRCLSRLIECYGEEGGKRLLRGAGAIRNGINAGSVDCVVLCNVLHEIEPKQWMTLLGPSGEIYESLAENGVLLIVEDQLLRDGERAHDYNFLVLSEHELKALFGVLPENIDIASMPHPRYPNRLKMHRVPRSLLANITNTTIAKALARLVENSKNSAEALVGSTDAASGRLYGFWTMQHFNATTALSHWKS